MKICVVGWYFYNSFYNSLKDVNKKYEIIIISHKGISKGISSLPNNDLFYGDDSETKYAIDFLESCGLSYKIIENIGLEFGAYDYYLKNCWDGESNVLFMHDDAEVIDIEVFDRIAALENDSIDQAYLFKNKQEDKNNGGKHGRAIYMSSKLLSFMLNYTFETEESKDHIDNHHNKGSILKGTGSYSGFWYDPNNYGHTTGKPPIGVRHYNEMIYNFHRTMGKIRDKRYKNDIMNVVNRCYFPELDEARRGKFRLER